MKHLRKLAFLMVVVTIFVSAMIPFSASAATPRLNNTLVTSENFFITDDGVATIGVSYTGYSDITTGATVTVELQKKTLLWWSDVCSWTLQYDGWINSETLTTQLNKTGEYRAIIEYTIRGSGGEADVLSVTLTDEY